jgi:magnesium transporter
MKIKQFSSFRWTVLSNPDQAELERLTESFDLNINLLEDSLQHGHLPKLEEVEDYSFVIFRAYSAADDDLVTSVSELSNKIAFFINEHELLTIHRADFDFLKQLGDDYDNSEALMLDIIDLMIDSFDRPLQVQSDKIDAFERAVFLEDSKSISLKELYFQKSKARISKKLLTVSQHVLAQMTVSPSNASRLQDIRDSAMSSVLLYDEVSEDASNLMNSYLSITAGKSNDVMKLLTVFSAFFLPLTFIAGVYGMNFDHMPELRTAYGYFVTLALMGIISLGIYLWFKRKKII